MKKEEMKGQGTCGYRRRSKSRRGSKKAWEDGMRKQQ